MRSTSASWPHSARTRIANADGAIDLRSVPLFEGLSKVEVARLVPELEDVALAPGDVLMRQGDPGGALSTSRVWRLSRARLDRLMLDDPAFAIRFNHLLGSRLANVSRHLTDAKDALAALSRTVWDALAPEVQDLLARAAPLHGVTA